MTNNVTKVDDENKTAELSNPGKLLRAYMQATGVHCAKALADSLGIKLRTIQRLKLEIACANDAKCAISGAANSANDAIDGVSQQSDVKKVSPTPPSKNNSNLETTVEIVTTPQSPPKKNFSTMFTDPAIEHGVTIESGRVVLVNGTRQFWLDQFGNDAKRLDLALVQAFGELQPGSMRAVKPQIERTLSRIAGEKLDRDQRYTATVQANAKQQQPSAAIARTAAMRAILREGSPS